MRILLATAVAIAPLMMASGAAADVVISTARTTPITTGNATGSGPDNIQIANGGSILVTSGVALTVNSSNNVEMLSGSTITMGNSADGSVGILVNGGNTSNLTIAGTISVIDDLTADSDLDTDNDGDDDGPWANGSNRVGIHVAGASPLTGTLELVNGGAVVVAGNDSTGVLVEAPMIGNVNIFGAINIRGDNSYALRTTGAIDGNVNLTGAINARGEGVVGVSIEGDVSGRVMIESAITASGFRYTSALPDRPADYVETAANDADNLFRDELDPDDLLIGGPAVQIAANVGNGVIFDRAPAYSAAGIEGDDDNDGVANGDEDDDADGTINRNDTDRDGDGIPDAQESTATITSYGEAPAVVIGSASESINIGVAGTGSSAYGFINRGTITGQGVFAEFSPTAVQFGGHAGQTVTIDGGILNEGAIAALGINADTVAINIGEGLITPEFVNSGTITSGVSSDTAVSGTTILIDVGAQLPSLTNSGNILAAAGGGVSDVTAIRDLSGSLTSITNLGSLQANVTANADGDPITGQTIAIDVSANTTGVTILQNGVAGTATSTDPDTDGDGVPDSAEPEIYGDILLGSGDDVMDIRNGIVVGDVSFGAGADRLNITGGATVRGAITDTDGDLAINVTDGTLDLRNTSSQTLSDLSIGGDGQLIVSLDPNDTGSRLNVTGTATLADGAGLGVHFNSLLAPGAGTQRFGLISAGSLNAGAIDLDSVQDNSPYLYVVEAGVDTAANEVFADVRQRTTEEAGMISVEASLYDAFYNSLTGSSDSATALRDAFLSQISRDDFFNLYEQLLPEHSGGPLVSLASGVDAVTRALTGRNASAAPGETSAWVQEINFYADKDKTDTYGFRSEGFGVAGGVERGTGLGAVGLSVAFTSSDLEDPESEAEEVLTAGGFGGLLLRAEDWAPRDKLHRSYELMARYVMPQFQGSLTGIIDSQQRSASMKESLQANRRAGLKRATDTFLARPQ